MSDVTRETGFLMQQTELGKLIGGWDAKVPASEDATALLTVLLEIDKRLKILAFHVGLVEAKRND